MDRWEYIRPAGEMGNGYLSDKELNDLGKQGWEIASFDPHTSYYTFKRKIPASPSQTVQKPNPQLDDDFGIRF